MAHRVFKYGSYTFPNQFTVAQDDLPVFVPQARIPRRDGAHVLSGTQDAKRLSVRGGFYKGPLAPTLDVRGSLDALRTALRAYPDGIDTLQVYDDRYYRCVQAVDYVDNYNPNGIFRMVDVAFAFLLPDPFQYALSPTSDSWTVSASNQTRTITPTGGAPSLPTLRVTVGGSGSETIAFTISNETTGESFTLAGDVNAGDVIEVDSLLHTVEISGTNKLDLFDGQFPSLLVGGNILREVYSASSITSIQTVYRNRWY